MEARDLVDLREFSALARVHIQTEVEHLLLCDGLRTIQLDGPPRVFEDGPVCLRYAIGGLDAAERPLLAMRRFLAFCRRGRFLHSLHPREARARRWITILRTRDGLAAGASQREIASELLSGSVGDIGWRSREPSVRSRVQRLVRSARCMAAGEFKLLLR